MTAIVDTVVYRNGARMPDITVLQNIQREFGLHELAIEDAHHAHQRPRIEAYSNSLLIVLKTAQLESGQVVYGETHLFVGANFLVSVRHGASASYAQVLQRCENDTKGLPKGPGFALYAVLDFVADNHQPVVAQ